MPKTTRNDSLAVLERPRIAAALQRARQSVAAQPPANALEVVQGVLMPLLSSFGVDVFDLERFRLDGAPAGDRVEYRLRGQANEVLFVVVPAAAALPVDVADESDAVVLCNGSSLRIGSRDGREYDLFDESLPGELARLLNGDELPAGSAGRYGRVLDKDDGHDTGEKAPARKRQQKEFVPAGPFERITIEEVRGYAEAVRNMHGKLLVWFDGERVDITSRSAFYYVLAELALRHGREDAIPGEDLILPPDQPPDDHRSRPLARPGSHLLVDHEPASIEERTRGLLEALGLANQFRATQRGNPYPAQSE